MEIPKCAPEDFCTDGRDDPEPDLLLLSILAPRAAEADRDGMRGRTCAVPDPVAFGAPEVPVVDPCASARGVPPNDPDRARSENGMSSSVEDASSPPPTTIFAEARACLLRGICTLLGSFFLLSEGDLPPAFCASVRAW